MIFEKSITPIRKFLNKRKTYFYPYNSDTIGIYKKDYLKLKRLLPFHSVKFCEVDTFAFITLSCPYKNPNLCDDFVQYGYSLNPTSKSVNYEYPTTFARSSEPKKEKDYLPEGFSPCDLCNNELACMFTKARNFQPRDYDIRQITKILHSKGYTKSSEMLKEYEMIIMAHYDEDGYLLEQPIGLVHLFILLIITVPLLLLMSPVFFVLSIFSSVKKKADN